MGGVNVGSRVGVKWLADLQCGGLTTEQCRRELAPDRTLHGRIVGRTGERSRHRLRVRQGEADRAGAEARPESQGDPQDVSERSSSSRPLRRNRPRVLRNALHGRAAAKVAGVVAALYLP